MNQASFKSSLKSLGWSQSQLAERLGVTSTTVSRWATGQVEIPQYAVSYMELAMKVKDFSTSCLGE